MRNLPEWVVAFAAITSIGAVSVSLNAWWTEDELDYGLEDSGATVLIADPERVERTRGGLRAPRRRARSACGCRPARTSDGVDRWEDVVVPGAPLPDVDGRPGRRRHDPLHVGHDRPSEGRGVDAPRRRSRRSPGSACRPPSPALRSPTRRQAASALPPVFILIVPLFHVTGCVPVMLSCCGQRARSS